MTEQAPKRIDAVKNWLLAKHEDRTDIAPDEDLIESRLVDSLSFVDFVFLIQEAGDVEIDLDSLDINDVRTLATIEKRFLAG
ncbi:MAG TPA: phosphopantetheine-binding protein [Streptomyces sp.]|nr:phosphopantetheine-binding protein [Streptomyces sp.]